MSLTPVWAASSRRASTARPKGPSSSGRASASRSRSSRVVVIGGIQYSAGAERVEGKWEILSGPSTPSARATRRLAGGEEKRLQKDGTIVAVEAVRDSFENRTRCSMRISLIRGRSKRNRRKSAAVSGDVLSAASDKIRIV